MQRQSLALAQRTYDSIITHRWLLWLILIGGMLLRLIQYLHQRPLWIDEVRLVLNLVNRSYSELALPLDYDQGSPLGFLYLQKFIIELLGQSELTFRISSLVSSILALLVFTWIAQYVLTRKAFPFAVAIMAFSGPLIYYSSEFKQYTSDMLIALVVLALGLRFYKGHFSGLRMLLWGIVGAVLIWFAHPTVFMLAGVGTGLIVAALADRDWKRFVRLVISAVIWLVSFGFYYASSLTSLTTNSYLREFWQGGFLPLSPGSLVYWLTDHLVYTFYFPLGWQLNGLALFFFIIGVLTFYVQDKFKLVMITGPIVFTLLASALGQYPYADRMILFVMPLYMLPIAEGLEQLRSKLVEHSTSANYGYIMSIASLILVGLFFLHPLRTVVLNLTQPYIYPSSGLEDIKSVLQHLEDNAEMGDTAYIYYDAILTFQYYQQYYNLPELNLVFGEAHDDDPQQYIGELDALPKAEQVWFIFNHVRETQNGFNEENFLLFLLDNIGTQTDAFVADGAAVYQYNLSQATES